MARKHKLARRLGIGLVTIYGLGNIVGAGIYALIGKVAGEAGMATPLAFVVAMLVALLSALSFAEFSSSHPYSEGATAYVHAAFRRKRASLIVGLLMTLATLISSAALARSFGGYLSSATGLGIPIGAILIILFLGLLVAWGIEGSAKLAAALTVIEVIGLGMIIWFGRSELGSITQDPGKFVDLSGVGVAGLLSAVFLAFYAYIGVEDMVHLSEETKNTRKVMPVAIISAILLATVLYVVVAIVAIGVVPISELNSSSAPLSLVFNKISNTPAWVITIIALAASAGGVLAHILSGSRLLYGMAEAGWLHRRLAVVHEARKSPITAIIVVVIAASVLAATVDITVLAGATSYLILFIFALVNGSLIIVKLRKSYAKKPYFKVPFMVPVTGLVTCIGLLVFQTLITFNLL